MILDWILLARWLNPFVWWRRLQRSIDAQVLIPELRKAANGNRSAFTKGFLFHAQRDRAWLVPDWELTEAERRFLDGLGL